MKPGFMRKINVFDGPHVRKKVTAFWKEGCESFSNLCDAAWIFNQDLKVAKAYMKGVEHCKKVHKR